VQERKRREREAAGGLGEEEQERYSAFKQSSFYKKQPNCAMRRMLNDIAGHQVNEKAVLVVCSVAKLFVGELVEAAREVAEAEEWDGPLRTDHIRAAYGRLHEAGKLPQVGPRGRLFL